MKLGPEGIGDDEVATRRDLADRERVTIGRASNASLQLDIDNVSRMHAVVRRTSRGYVLADLDWWIDLYQEVYSADLAGRKVTVNSLDDLLSATPRTNDVTLTIQPAAQKAAVGAVRPQEIGQASGAFMTWDGSDWKKTGRLELLGLQLDPDLFVLLVDREEAGQRLGIAHVPEGRLGGVRHGSAGQDGEGQRVFVHIAAGQGDGLDGAIFVEGINRLGVRRWYAIGHRCRSRGRGRW